MCLSIHIFIWIYINNEVINKLYDEFQSPGCKVRYMTILWINIASQRYVISFQMDHTYTFDVTTEEVIEEVVENGIVPVGEGADLLLQSIVGKGNSIRTDIGR